MAKYLTTKWRIPTEGYLQFFCPGCNEIHIVSIPHEKFPGKQTWGFEFKDNKVTLSPSVKVSNGHYADHYKPSDNCWCTFNKEHPNNPNKFKCGICHSFIKDDKIQFLSDCTHELANQTVELPNFPDDLIQRDEEDNGNCN